MFPGQILVDKIFGHSKALDPRAGKEGAEDEGGEEEEGPLGWEHIAHPAQPGSPTVTINNTSPVS